MIAVMVVALISSGIYTLGIVMFQISQTNRIMTEAQAFAKAGLEEIVSLKYDVIGSADIPTQTNYTDSVTHKSAIVRSTDMIWHAADGSITNTYMSDGYVEIHVSAQFNVPGSTRTVNSTFSTVIIHDGNES